MYKTSIKPVEILMGKYKNSYQLYLHAMLWPKRDTVKSQFH